MHHHREHDRTEAMAAAHAILGVLSDLEIIIGAGRVEDLKADARIIRREMQHLGRDGYLYDVGLAMNMLDALPPELRDGHERDIIEAWVAARLRRAMAKAIHELAAEIRADERERGANLHLISGGEYSRPVTRLPAGKVLT